jgi:lipopolysaccharide/colanic/teichoic acid biosynthesis glycosyltransferase
MREFIRRGLPRSIQVLFALSALLLLLPLLIAAAICVKLTSRGTFLFRQRRMGRNGRVFTLYKLRTMYSANDGPLVTAASDCRVTTVGRFLRKTKIDEMPQFWNVVIGDMDLIGPRPEVPELVDFNDPMWSRILSVRPGLSDPITLSLRNEEALLGKYENHPSFYKEVLQPLKMKGYIRCLEQRSWRNDLKLIVQTARFILVPGAVVSMPGNEDLQLAFPD